MVFSQDGKPSAAANGRPLAFPVQTFLFLSAAMLVYIFVLPATFLIGWVDNHLEYIQELFTGLIPHFYFAAHAAFENMRFTHTFPVALWCVLGSIQLYLQWVGERALHKWLGRAFAADAIVVWLGIWHMIAKDFGFFVQNWKGLMILGNLWFGFTLCVSVLYARKRAIALHEEWMWRHLAIGMAPTIQRFILLLFVGVGLRNWFGWSEKDIFSLTAPVAFLGTPLCLEVWLRLRNANRTAKRRTLRVPETLLKYSNRQKLGRSVVRNQCKDA